MSDGLRMRLIETDFPLRAVSEESVREKNIRHGHISTLHIWWARRPLAASRATALAALLPDDPRHRHKWLRLVRDIAPWEAVSSPLLSYGREPVLSLSQEAVDEGFSPLPEHGRGARGEGLIAKARALIRAAYGGRAPRV
ncbi:MAG: DUF1156 domain-containing protein, partial [Chloroflexi bacterium]|nr:DUF1156 domain-containing protein [Chloroflexota bacterium]